MTSTGIKHLATELAGQFYEQKRSDRFRSKDALTRARTLKRLPNGQLAEVPVTVPFFKAYPTSNHFAKGHWPMFIEAARKCYIAMLSMPESRISQHMKETIAAELIEDRKHEYKFGGKRMVQRHLGDAEPGRKTMVGFR